MKCEQALSLISAALDGEVSEAGREALDGHLAGCPRCRELAEDFRLLSGELSRMEPPPDGLAARISAALEGEILQPEADARGGTAAQVRPPLWRRYGALAAVLALALCLGAVYHFSGARDQAALLSSFTPGAAEAYAEVGTEPTAGTSAAEGRAASDGAAMAVAEDGAAPIATDPASPVTVSGEEVARAGALVLEAIGYPGAAPDASRPYTAYLLERRQTADGSAELWLEYAYPSPNGEYLLFQLREYSETGSGPEGVSSVSFVNRYAVSLNGGPLLTEYGEGRTGAQAEAFRHAIGE